MPKIVLLEDEQALREEVADFLASQGHEVLQAASLAEFAPLSGAGRVAVLDVMLPDGSGYDALGMIRQSAPRTGIVMLTALGALNDRVAGLAAGADHYLVKPFRLLELQAVIEALLRRVGREWVFDERTSQLHAASGASLELSTKEAQFMALLARAGGQPVSRRQIVQALGHDWASYDLRRLDTLVSRLRTRWLKETGQDLPLKTLHGEGYAFGASIELG